MGSSPTISMLNWQLNRFSFLLGVQVSKGLGWMPRLTKGMKGVLSCDKPGGGAKACEAWMPEWGNPIGC